MNIYNELKLNEDILSHINYQLAKFQYIHINRPTVINMSIDVYNFIDNQSRVIYGFNHDFLPCELFGIKINLIEGIKEFVSFGYENFDDNWRLCMRGERG